MISKNLPIAHQELAAIENMDPNIIPHLLNRHKSAPVRKDAKTKPSPKTPKNEQKIQPPSSKKTVTPIITTVKEKMREAQSAPPNVENTSPIDRDHSISPPLTARELFHDRISNTTSDSDHSKQEYEDILYREDDFKRFLGGWSGKKEKSSDEGEDHKKDGKTDLVQLHVEYQKIQGRLDNIEREKEIVARENERKKLLEDSEKIRDQLAKRIDQLESQLHQTHVECEQVKTNFREYRLQNDLITKQLQQQIDDLRNRQIQTPPIMYYTPPSTQEPLVHVQPVQTPPRETYSEPKLSNRMINSLGSNKRSSPANSIASMPNSLPKPVLSFNTKSSPTHHSSPVPRASQPRPVPQQSSPYITYQGPSPSTKVHHTPVLSNSGDRTIIVQKFVTDNGQEETEQTEEDFWSDITDITPKSKHKQHASLSPAHMDSQPQKAVSFTCFILANFASTFLKE
jgi:TolA-binding protein